MHALLLGLLAYFLFFLLFWAACSLITLALPDSFFGRKAALALVWLPPFIRGETLHQWAAVKAEQLAQRHLCEDRTGAMATQLAKEVEDGAMRAMLPLSESEELDRVIACPENGQGLIGVTAPEVFAIADYIRKKLSRTEQERILRLAVANVDRLVTGVPGEIVPPVLPCPLQGKNRVCCVYGARPLRCRPLHAISIAKDADHDGEKPACSPIEAPEEYRHARTVANGISVGLSKAMESACLSARIYELNSALVVALEIPNASERWAKGEDVFVHAIGVPASAFASFSSKDCVAVEKVR
jgi:hypothetical protein